MSPLHASLLPQAKSAVLSSFLSACLLAVSNTPPDTYYEAETLREEYDFIVVGSGSAGSVVANRLSAIPDVTVLLIEAGGAPDVLTEVPFLAALQLGGKYDWKYETVPQENACLGLKEKRSRWTRGKVLGGTSVLNGMVYVRGNKEDYEGWVENFGATGWSYEDVLPYFKEIETFYVPEYANNGYHGNDGEVAVGYAPYHTKASEAFLDGMAELGYQYVDYNGPSQIGYSRVQLNTKDGKRVSSSKAFILPIVKERPNLDITLASLATKIEFDGKRAVGVRFEKLGTQHFAQATREVILSSGALNSPQLLMLSGVGPKEHLEEHKIPVLADLPVGQNLQDHIFIGGLAATLEEDAELQPDDPSAMTAYCSDNDGPYSVPAGIEGIAFMRTPISNNTLEHPDTQFLFFGISPASEPGELFHKALGYKDEVYDTYYLPKRGQPAIQVAGCINKIKSRGEIRLQSADPHDPPLFDPKYFSHPDDILTGIQVAHKATEVMQSNPMKALGAKLWDIPLPGCEDKAMYSDDYMECLMRHLLHTEWHFGGTCAMGSHNRSVVDPRLRVRGVTNLRVIDASIMPELTTGNINAPTMMIGAKGAAMVLEDNGLTGDVLCVFSTNLRTARIVDIYRTCHAVGSGSAGSIVANRLSAAADVSVLVIEAGGAPDAMTEIPFLAALQLWGKYDWKYETVPQRNACLGLIEQRSRWIRGKVLGGTGTINGMLHVRGNREDFDGWVTNYGATGWSFEEVLPYFKSIETFYVPEYANNGYHGHQGELPIGYAPSQSVASKAYLEGWRQLGYRSVDYNGPSQIGYSRPQVNNANGRRVSSSTAFILPIVKERPNLHITLRSLATKIQFEGNRAVGVHFAKLGVPHFARARREVILSAGAIGSPQLLMLSGVGPKEHLEQFQIPVLADIPVGENLQDHVIIGGLAFTLEKNAGLHPEALSAYESYCSRGTGPFSVPAGIEAISFTRTSITNDARPDAEYYFFGISPAGVGSEEYHTVALGYTEKVYSKYYLPKKDEYAVQVSPGINGLKSRGVIKLRTTDPYDHPIIDPNYFSHPDDVLIAIEASKIALQVMQTDAMKSLGARPWDIPLPGCEDKLMYSDEYLECLARHLTHTEGHYAGTCAMGTHECAVVDPRLRVRGVTHLRVIDASVMPEVITGNTNAPAMMIAEKGSAMVLEDNGLTECTRYLYKK
ncbi:uncharacterized protein LOC135369775 [Ornithodoros turicata]|uniref:uncharacterized protein LOC135369775 n=1 Tax=Ornithodoros turicata TaxID=34597 RepID=UPI003139EFEF